MLSAYYSFDNIFVYNRTQTSNEFVYDIVDTNYIKKRGFFAAFGETIDKNGLFNVTYRLEKHEYGLLAQEDSNRSQDNMLSLLGFTLKYDSEDLPHFAKTGSILDFSLETNIFAINEYTKFTKIIAYLKTNFNFNTHHTLSPSLFFGAGDNTLPYPEYFAFGGQNNFYGFRNNQEMGRQMFRFSLEYKYELPEFLSVLSLKSMFSARYDLGSVWELPTQIKLSTLTHGLGCSYAVATPIGPAVFSVGRALELVSENNIFRNIRWGDFLMYFNLGVRL